MVFVTRFSEVANRVARENSLLCEKFTTRSWVCEYVRNNSDGSNHVEASVPTPEAINGKTFRRLTKVKATIARETEKGKNCRNFAWLDENETVHVLGKEKQKNSQCVSAIA